MIKWEISECANGEYKVEKIGRVEKNVLAEYKPGYMMGAILYESSRFKTRKEAEKYLDSKTKKNIHYNP